MHIVLLFTLADKCTLQFCFQNSLYRVFVYGTLKRGEPNHKLIENTTNGYAKFLGSGKTVTKYPLVIATKYNVPFLLKKSGIGHVSLRDNFTLF